MPGKLDLKIYIILFFIFSSCLGSCKNESSGTLKSNEPSVILISLDTVRADHLSCFGYHRATTPGIDRIAEEGVTFTRAFTQIAHTLPAHLSLFMSRYPREHKVLFNDWKPLEKFPVLAESLKTRGIKTGAIVSAAVLEAEFGLGPGFDYYDDECDSFIGNMIRDRKIYRRTADKVVDRAIKWLKKQDSSKPFFLFLHFFDAHTNYDLTPKEYSRMFKTDPQLTRIMETRNQDERLARKINHYDGSIRFVDDELSRFWSFLNESGVYDKALIIIISDHGECLGQHNWYHHGLYVYEELMHIPVIMRFPEGEHAGKKIDALVSLVDIAPTILDFYNVRQMADSRGKSLLPLVRGETDNIYQYIFLERRWYPEKNEENKKNWAPGEKFGVRSEKWKYIWASEEADELFDLEKDPHELTSIASEHPDIMEIMKKELDNYFALVKKEIIVPQEIDEKSRKKLEALGYLK